MRVTADDRSAGRTLEEKNRNDRPCCCDEVKNDMGVKVFIIFFGLHGGRLSSAIKIKSRGEIRYGRGIFLS